MQVFEIVDTVGAGHAAAVRPQRVEPMAAVFLLRLLGGTVTFQCETSEQLRPAQPWVPGGGGIQSGSELVALGHQDSRASGRHFTSVTPSTL